MKVEIEVYKFPTLEPENYNQISAKVNELHRRYRDRRELNEIEVDWLDTANNWLMSH